MSSNHSDASVPVSSVADENQKGKPSPSLRKSCQFCRSRKIRCSGQNICNACRERNIECSYGACGQKGRPRGGPTRTPSQDTSGFQSGPPTPFLEPSNPSYVSEGQSTFTVATNLENMFHRLMGSPIGNPATSSNHLLDTLSNHIPRGSFLTSTRPQISAHTPPSKTLSYDSLFFVLAPEVIEIVASRVGSFCCQQPVSNRHRYFAKTFLVDRSTSMFESISPSIEEGDLSSGIKRSINLSNNPLEGFNGHLMVQLLDIWFSQHPLAFMLCKTLLLREIRNGTYDEILVSAMLADVQYAQGNGPSRETGKSLLSWSTSKLQEVSQSAVTLSTIQAVVLLGWRCLCIGSARRAICYFVWATEALHFLPTLQSGVNTINGIDVGAIQQESHRNASWLMYSIKIWALLQLNILEYQQAPSSTPPYILSDESYSESFRLDRTSHNLATLGNQERMYREMCLLSQVSATVTRVFAIPPRGEEMSNLRDLQSQKYHTNGNVGERVRCCTQIRSVLLNSIESIKSHSQGDYLKCLTLCALHTVLIHNLFPPGGFGDSPIGTGGMSQLIVDFYSSAKCLLQVFSIHDALDKEGSSSGRTLMSRHFSSMNDLFALAIDSCGRGMNSIYFHGQNGTEMERNCIRENASILASLAAELHAFSKEINTTRLKSIKKLLKEAIRQFDNPQVDFRDSYSSTTTSSRAGSMGIPESELNAAFDNTDFSFGYDHISTSLAGIGEGGFYGYGIPALADDTYDVTMSMRWGMDTNIHDMSGGGVGQ